MLQNIGKEYFCRCIILQVYLSVTLKTLETIVYQNFLINTSIFWESDKRVNDGCISTSSPVQFLSLVHLWL